MVGVAEFRLGGSCPGAREQSTADVIGDTDHQLKSCVWLDLARLRARLTSIIFLAEAAEDVQQCRGYSSSESGLVCAISWGISF